GGCDPSSPRSAEWGGAGPITAHRPPPRGDFMKQMSTSLCVRWTRAALSVLALGLALCNPAKAATTIDMATGVTAGVGIASDPVNANIYYVEFNGGTLKRIHITPGCDLTSPPTCPITPS